MKAVKINKDELLEIVRANKEKHITDFAEAVDDYKEVVLKICNANLKKAATADLDAFTKIKSMPHAPQSYDDEYTRAIRMLELSVDEIIEVEQDVFNQLVLDEWHWKSNFTMMNATYKTLL